MANEPRNNPAARLAAIMSGVPNLADNMDAMSGWAAILKFDPKRPSDDVRRRINASIELLQQQLDQVELFVHTQLTVSVCRTLDTLVIVLFESV